MTTTGSFAGQTSVVAFKMGAALEDFRAKKLSAQVLRKLLIIPYRRLRLFC